MAENSPEYRQQLYADGRFEDLLESIKEELNNSPKDPDLLYNAGLVSYLLKNYSQALKLWTDLKKITPDDYQLRGKLIQTYEALEKFKEREIEKEELYTLVENLENPLEAPKQYCRDQFHSANLTIRVYENFELLGDTPAKYIFYVFKSEEENPVSTIVLGSFEDINNYMRENGDIKGRERAFHLDEYLPDDTHKTWEFYIDEPGYDEVKKAAKKIIDQGKY